VYGIESTDGLRQALQASDLISPGERESLLFQLRDIRGNIRRKIERAGDASTPPPAVYYHQPTSVYIHNDLGTIHMEDKSVSIGDVGGSIEGAIGSDISISESFNRIETSSASSDVKTVLKQLVQASEQLGATLPGAEADQARRDVNILIDEATSPKPRRSTIEAVGGSLVDMAKTVGEVGAPVVTLVTQLVALFS
jgi:hypothetical protein